MLLHFRQLSLASLIGALLGTATPAQAFEVTRGELIYYDVIHNRYGDPPATPSEVGSRARDAVSRQGYIEEDGAQQRVEEQDPAPEDADFQGVFTSTPGVTVGMRSSLVPLSLPSPPPPAPARAMTELFANHALAATARSLAFSNQFNDGEAQDNGNPLDDYFVRTDRSASAESRWGDTWLATKNEHVTIPFALDGRISLNEPCGDVSHCVISMPSGTDIVRTRDFDYEFEAMMAVIDLSTVVSCESVSDQCDGEGDAPLVLDSLRIRSGRFVNDAGADRAVLEAGEAIDVALAETLGFDAVAGHSYYVVGLLSVTSENGVVLDFFNTFRMTGVGASPGNLLSSALDGQDVTTHFSAVPLPGALWMTLGGLGVLSARRRRRQDS